MCAINFTNNTSRSDWTWHNLRNFLLTITFKYKYFHNSVDRSGLIFFRVYSVYPFMIGKNFKIYIQFLDYWKMHLWNSPTLGMIWSLIHQYRIVPKICKSIPKKVPPCFFGGETIYPCSTGKSCGGICSHFILC